MSESKKSTKPAPFAPTEGFAPIGQNVYAKVEGDRLTIELDLGADLGKSASGKSLKVATTGGNVSVGDGLKLGLNVYEPVSLA